MHRPTTAARKVTSAAPGKVTSTAKVTSAVTSEVTSAGQGASATIPVYRWNLAPEGLATRGQLRARGLRPVGDPVGEIRWRSRLARRTGGERVAYLYPTATAVEIGKATEGQRRGLAAAMLARRTCPTCRTDRGYVIPTSLGECWPCHEGPEDAPAPAA